VARLWCIFRGMAAAARVAADRLAVMQIIRGSVIVSALLSTAAISLAATSWPIVPEHAWDPSLPIWMRHLTLPSLV
jgi:hypothetical protein